MPSVLNPSTVTRQGIHASVPLGADPLTPPYSYQYYPEQNVD